MLSQNGKKPQKDENTVTAVTGVAEHGSYKQFLKKIWRKDILSNLWLAIIIIVFFIYPLILPTFYTRDFYFPEDSEIKHSKGVFVYRDGGKDGFYAGVEKNGEKVFFHAFRSMALVIIVKLIVIICGVLMQKGKTPRRRCLNPGWVKRLISPGLIKKIIYFPFSGEWLR